MSCMQKYSTYSGRWPSLKAGSMRHMTHGRESRQCQLDWRRCASTPWCLESSLLRCLGQLQDSPAGSRSFRHRGRSCPGKEDSGVSCDSADETPSAGTATAAVRTTHTMVEELPHIGIRIRKGSTPAARLGSLVEVAGGKQLPGYTHQPMTAVNSTVKSFTSTPTCSHVSLPKLREWAAQRASADYEHAAFDARRESVRDTVRASMLAAQQLHQPTRIVCQFAGTNLVEQLRPKAPKTPRARQNADSCSVPKMRGLHCRQQGAEGSCKQAGPHDSATWWLQAGVRAARGSPNACTACARA